MINFKRGTFLFCGMANYGMCVWHVYHKYKEAPIYFSNIFISFLGLAYFTPLWCLLKLFFWLFGGTIGSPHDTKTSYGKIVNLHKLNANSSCTCLRKQVRDFYCTGEIGKWVFDRPEQADILTG